MSSEKLIQEVLQATPEKIPFALKTTAITMILLGIVGLAISFGMGNDGAGWVAILVSAVMIIGLAVAGIIFSAIFQITAAKWGRSYRRLAEGSVVLMPVGIVLLVIYLIGADAFIPWAHMEHLTGGKHVWLVRGFWDARVLGSLILMYAMALYFLYLSLRKDFCIAEVRNRFATGLGAWLAKGIRDDNAERLRCDTRMSYLAPPVVIAYAIIMSFLAFDLIMALEPDWFSTLFGAWYFISHLFVGTGIIVTLSLYYKAHHDLGRFLPELKQRDIATILFAFCFLSTSFFWDQFLTIWYANLPEETHFLINRAQGSLGTLVIVGLATFFLLPFVALIFRKVKHSRMLLSTVSAIALIGIFIMRFLEIAPPTLSLKHPAVFSYIAIPLLGSFLVLLGSLGIGLWLYAKLLTKVPVMPIGDDIFANEFTEGNTHE